MITELHITRLTGFQRGKTTRFTESPVILGSAEACSLAFDPTWDKTVSEKHATIEWRGDAWWIVDHSEQGCWISGQRLSAPRPLEPRTEIELGRGGPKITVEYVQTPMVAPAPEVPVGGLEPTSSTVSYSRSATETGTDDQLVGTEPPALGKPNRRRLLASLIGGAVLALMAVGTVIYLWNSREHVQDAGSDIGAIPPDGEMIALLEEVSENMDVPPSTSIPTSDLPGKGWAVIVGVNAYSNGVNSLEMCVNDANAIAKTLDRSGIFSEERIYLMTDESRADLQPTSINVERILKSVIAQAAPEDIVLFSFSGHGTWDDAKEDSMLLTSDANPENLERTTLSGATLKEFFERLDAEKLIVIMDACHSGGIQVKGRKAVRQVAQIPESFFTQFTNSKGQVTIRSCAYDEYSYEAPELGHGLFTYHLVQALGGEADYDSDGIVTLSEARTHLGKNVLASALERFGAPQTPSFTSGGFLGEVGDIPITIVAENRARRAGAIDFLKERAGTLAAQDKITSGELDTIKQTLADLSGSRSFTSAQQERIKLTLRLLLGKTPPADYRLASRSLGLE